jgi:hypothetical protein
LQKYKNCFEQKPGFQDETFRWMNSEAEKENCDKCGGIILDEMSVQEDMSIEFRGDVMKIVGLVDFGKASDVMYQSIKNGTKNGPPDNNNNKIRLASHILQFIFLGYDGFRFPFGYFPTKGANAPELYLAISNALQKLLSYDFKVDFICFDGASANRVLMHMFFDDDIVEKKFTCYSLFANVQMTFLMDPSHVVKRIRNNIYASGDQEGKTRKLKHGEDYIIWDHWVAAFEWDRTNNFVRIHQALTEQHFNLTNPSKMRNKLAEDVLNEEMLKLMLAYKNSLSDEVFLQGSIRLLEETSKIVNVFRDFNPLCDVNDSRLVHLNKAQQFFSHWENDVMCIKSLTAGEKSRRLMSRETREDIQSVLLGFCEICKRRITKTSASVTPGRMNSDIVENNFCQQRSKYHGANANPTVAQYKHGITSVILGQKVISKKSNAFMRIRSADPYTFSSPVPLNGSRKRKRPSK